MRYIRGLLVAVSAGALTLGMGGASQALDTDCKGSTGSCATEASFAPQILGDISLIDTSELIGPSGLINTSGLTGTSGLLSLTGQTITNQTTSPSSTTGTTGTTAATGKAATTGVRR
ncbi:hypothetical protein OG361_25000 [Streptomyces sp. NBC_00090]|uniref:hypothetical protein n=1 Tax=Streptomyces sp. NBC_00090 TaxID=2903619 RepID=UPI0032519508